MTEEEQIEVLELLEITVKTAKRLAEYEKKYPNSGRDNFLNLFSTEERRAKADSLVKEITAID